MKKLLISLFLLLGIGIGYAVPQVTQHCISLTASEEADFAPYLKGRTIPETIRQDYVDGNILPAAENARRAVVAQKLQELPDAAKITIAALKAQKEQEVNAAIEAEHDKLPPKP